jgi:hypothetical protein
LAILFNRKLKAVSSLSQTAALVGCLVALPQPINRRKPSGKTRHLFVTAPRAKTGNRSTLRLDSLNRGLAWNATLRPSFPTNDL